jgi:hypothetical protein
VETGSREETALKQKIEPGFDSIKTEMALALAEIQRAGWCAG